MGKNISITVINENLDPKISELLSAHEGRLPASGEVWVLFRDVSGTFDHMQILSSDTADGAIELASKYIVREFEDENIISAEVYFRRV